MDRTAKEDFCFQLNQVIISQSWSKGCTYGFKMKKEVTAEDLAPQGMCIFAFQAIYPYYITLKNKGWFSWVRPGEGVIVQCPNPVGALEMKVFPGDKKDSVIVKVIRARGFCPRGHKEGDSFLLSPDTFTFCPVALGAFISYLCLLAQGGDLPWKGEKKRWLVRCPDPKCGVLFTLTKREL